MGVGFRVSKLTAIIVAVYSWLFRDEIDLIVFFSRLRLYIYLCIWCNTIHWWPFTGSFMWGFVSPWLIVYWKIFNNSTSQKNVQKIMPECQLNCQMKKLLSPKFIKKNFFFKLFYFGEWKHMWLLNFFLYLPSLFVGLLPVPDSVLVPGPANDHACQRQRRPDQSWQGSDRYWSFQW